MRILCAHKKLSGITGIYTTKTLAVLADTQKRKGRIVCLKMFSYTLGTVMTERKVHIHYKHSKKIYIIVKKASHANRDVAHVDL